MISDIIHLSIYFKITIRPFVPKFQFRNYNNLMYGRPLNPGNDRSQKSPIFNNIKYAKPMNLINEGQQQTRNLYYDNNPYFLNQNTLNNRGKGIYNNSRNTNQSRDLSETYSQRSGKVIRANFMRVTQKPCIMKGVIQQRQSNLSQSRNDSQTRKLFAKNTQLEQENRMLKNQKPRQLQNMRIMEQMHKKQVFMLNSKLQTLLKKTEQLEHQVQQEDNQWKNRIQEISHVKTSDNSQINKYTNNNNVSHIAASTSYYSGSLALANTGSNNMKR